MIESAKTLEDLCNRQLISKKYESVYLAITGLAFDAAGEAPRSRKAYTSLLATNLPIEKAFSNSEYIAKSYTNAISYFGLRDLANIEEAANDVFRALERLQSRNKLGFSLDYPTQEDDRVILLGMLDLILKYKEVIVRKDRGRLSELASVIVDLQNVARDSDSASWLSMVVRLCCMAMNSAINRSILHLPLPESALERLIDLKRIELWTPQMEVVNKGFLEGQKMVVCTNTATGKTFLSSLLASKATRESKVAYLGPTRSLVEEVAAKMQDLLLKSGKTVAISTREHPETDENLNDAEVIVATYEKFSSITRRNLLSEDKIGSLVVDEVHKMSEEERGIPLEFILTQFKNLNGKGPQIVALSGMVNDTDVKDFSEWLEANYVKSSWRPVDLDEMIYCNGRLNRKDGSAYLMPVISVPGNDHVKRVTIAARLIQEEIIKDGQCMVVSLSRSKVEEVAQELCDILRSSEHFLPDIRNVRMKDTSLREDLISHILDIEPEMPLYARNLIELIQFGVAYHHAGLPLKYRSIIEKGVKSKAIRALVATTTLEAGVNLPVSMVIFPFPQERRGRFRGKLPVSSYRNLAGRAGRPDFDSKGKSILVALTEEEAAELRKVYFESDEERLVSAMTKFVRSVPQTRYAVQAEILGILDRDEKSEADLIDQMKKLWFWRSADEEYKEKLPKRLSWEIKKLRMFDFLEDRSGKLTLKPTGRLVTQSMLYPFSIKNLIDNCKKIIQGRFSGEKFDLLVLALVGVPKEMRAYDEIMSAVKVNPNAEMVKQIVKQDQSLMEQYDDTKLAAHFATVLWYWINAYDTERIIELTGLRKTDAAFIEESLREDAYWIISAMSAISDGIVHMTNSQRKRIKDLAKFCKLGCSDPVTVGLMESGLPHMGRSTAIKLSRFMKTSKKTLVQIRREDIEALFPDNMTCAHVLYDEIRSLLTGHGRS
ncbi:DEAD/DEAH box helicase [Nitrososphaera sp.]|uniref:DEAD/DEAH box helicase n=1 Tax=Nitrososphaera sp. TaxID=1971748 RepID=UPI0017B8FDE5|nr:DEAD/DEAH box helicase [Nitrososphaera sp.]NWG36686.1 DEAD/DEAH box helicase [Nitrososphaera sp.]